MFNKNSFKIPLHNIYVYVVLHGILLFVLRPILTYLYGENEVTGYIFSDYYNLSLGLGLFSFLFVLRFFNDNQLYTTSSIFYSERKIPIKRYLCVVSIWLSIYLVLNINRLRMGVVPLIFESQSDFIHSNSNFLSNSFAGTYSLLVLAVYFVKTTEKRKMLLIFFLLITALPIGIISGSKTLILNPFFVLLIRRSTIKNGISISTLVLLFILFVPVFLFLESMRQAGLAGVLSLVQNGNLVNIENSIFVSTRRFYGTDVLYSIIYHHQHLNHPYLYGSSLFGLLFFFVPRSIWPDKPIISFGKVVSEEYLGGYFWDTGISAAPTWIGELFANFGFFSLPVFLLTLFLIFRHIKRCQISVRKPWLQKFYFPLSFTTIAFFQEASIAGWVIQLFFMAFISWLFYNLFFIDYEKI